PVIALATGARVALRVAAVDAPRLEDGPVQGIADTSVGEPVEPALREVVPRVGLHLDRDVLVVGLLALLRRVVVVVPQRRVSEDLGPCLGGGELRLRWAALLCDHVSTDSFLLCT